MYYNIGNAVQEHTRYSYKTLFIEDPFINNYNLVEESTQCKMMTYDETFFIVTAVKTSNLS
jgi:hypothetical protein